MIGVILLSHGKMAEGMLDSCKLFFGEDLPAIQALCLHEGDEVGHFQQAIETAITTLDDGAGVVVLCDLFGGTPSNLCVPLLEKFANIKVITGMNLGILIEILGARLSIANCADLKIADILKVGQNNMVDLSASMNVVDTSSEEDFF